MTAQVVQPETRRLKILGDDEIEALYGQPRFTPDERIDYFSLTHPEKEMLQEFRSVRAKTYFILQLGYFKAKHLFFTFDLHETQDDVLYLLEHHFNHTTIDNPKPLNKRTRLKQQQLILELCHYRNCDAKARQKLREKGQQAARVDGKPIYVFRELISYLEEERIVAPGYSFMQETIGKALADEQERLITILQQHLKLHDLEALKCLLDDAPGLYEITQLKREPKDFSLREIKREIHRGEQIRGLYDRSKTLLPELEISNESIKYYASLVAYYSVFRLKRFDEWVAYLYLLCFVYHRYQKLHDNLLGCLIHHVRGYRDEAKDVAKDQVYEYRREDNQNLHKAGEVLKLFTDRSIPPHTPFYHVQAKAFGILESDQLDFVADHIATHVRFDETAFQWEHIDELANQFKRHLRPIHQAVQVEASSGHAPLIEAMNFLKTTFQKGRSLGQYPTEAFPTRFIPESTKRYLYGPETQGQKCLLPDRYEFLVYRVLRNGLEAGDIFCRDSVRFRSFEDDLIDDERWREKDKLIDDIGLPILKQPIRDHLAELEQQLESRLTEVNQRIISGDNEHFEIKRHGPQARWTLRYPGGSEPVNHPVFDGLKQADIGTVLHFVNQRCPFIAAFDHVLGRYAKTEVDDRVITACLIAWATNMGLGRMGDISDIGYPTLSAASDHFIRLETLREANDRISNAIAELPIFRHYDIGDALHSSSDGQKFETAINTINARYSPKYFGLKKGVVSYSLVANNVPVNARIIGANEHESHYVFDILFNNTTDIQPEIHSTDTHGTNEVNFALLHVFGYQFAPRYRDLYDKVRTSLYGFKHPSQYDDEMVLKPRRKLNPNLIIEEWDNIQRIMVSLALKTTTQNIIVGKLSAYARKNKTRRALWEYDHIIRSLYLLDYIDSPPLRQNVQRAVNRGESYHKLRRAVSYANFGKLRFKTEQEQQLWGECARLITNCIIYYNATILSNLLAHYEETDNNKGAALLKQISPVAWQHINFYGRYEFNRQPEAINIDEIIQKLAQIQVVPEPIPIASLA
jgi:TnpA family transposase